MNLRYVVKQLGLLLLVLSTFLVGSAALFFIVEATLHHDVSPPARNALFFSGLLGFVIGGVLWLLARKAPQQLGRREALLLVAATYIIGAAFVALPYFWWATLPGTDAPKNHPFGNPVNCYFEGMSGLTTTGATILSDIEAVPRSLLLWRAFTQWIGGVGIVVLFVAVLPSLGVGGKGLFQVEAPGPTTDGLQPQIRQTARVLLYIYLGLTAVQIIALMLAGMPLYDAVCHSFTTIATAGFSTNNASIGAYGTPVVIVIIVFMILGGINFGLYFALLRRRYASVLRDPELRTYLVLLALGSTVIVLCLLTQALTLTTGEQVSPSPGGALRNGIFTAVSIGTTTGYTTADYDTWPFAAKAVLVMFMFIGGCAGSTAGGIKVIRIWVAFKVMLAEIEHVFRPNVVRPVRVGRSILDDELKLGTVSYVLGIVLLFAAGSVGIMALEKFNEPGITCDYATAAGAALACLCTVGPGMAQVGAIENYGWLTPYTKILLSLLMALGRLEVFAIIVLLTPRFWHAD